MTFTDDPTDGLDPLGTVIISFTIQNSVVAGAPADTGTITGSGNLVAELGASTDDVAITGTMSLTDTAGAGCDADLTFPEGDPLNLDFGDEPPLEQLAANIGFFEIFGTIQAIIEAAGHELDADLTLTNGDQTVSVDGTIDEISVDFDFDLVPSDEALDQIFACFFNSTPWIDFFGQIYEDVKDAALGGVPPAGIIVLPTADPNVFNYTVDLLLYDPTTFTAGTITGQATLTFPVVTGLAGVLPTEVSFTWTIAGATFTTGASTSGQNATGRPFRLRLDGSTGDVLSYSGAGSITTTFPVLTGIITPPESCALNFDILESDPFTADETDGTIVLTLVVGEDELNAVLDLEDEGAYLTINGVPFPFFD
jgi:hypothetical protein